MLVPIETISYLKNLTIYPEIEKILDSKYPNDENTISQKQTGNYMFKTILKYLITHKKSTCKEIAKKYRENSNQSLKSITNNVRDFIKINLIPYYIVEEDELKKIKNKKIQTYSLTHFGILYTIHLFSKGKNSTYDPNPIRNITIEYKDYLPKIFNRFEEFKKTIGNNFEYTLSLHDISTHIDKLGSFHHFQDIANESVMYLDYLKLFRKKSIKEILEDQISYIIYNNLLDNIEIYEFAYNEKYNQLKKERKQFGDISNLTKQQLCDLKEINKKTDIICNTVQKKAKLKLKKIINSNPEISNWYVSFLNNSIKINEQRINELHKIKAIIQ